MKEALLKIINEIRAFKEMKPLVDIQDTDDLREDIGFSSFDLADLTVRIEDQFDVDIFESGLVSTIGEILGKIQH